MYGFSALHNRLHNCLQTILDLKNEEYLAPYHAVFSRELDALENILQRMSYINITEDDVERIEQATSRFFTELESLLQTGKSSKDKSPARLQ